LGAPRRADVCLGCDPADQRLPGLGREQALELGSRLFRPGEHDADAVEPANAKVERLGPLPQMAIDDLPDVTLEASLRSAALIMATGNVGRLVDERRELSRPQPVD